MTSTKSEKDELIQLSSHLICRENTSSIESLMTTWKENKCQGRRKQMPRKKILRVSPNVKADCDVSKFFMTLSLLFLSFCSTYSFNLDQNLAINKNHWIQQKMKKTRDKETELRSFVGFSCDSGWCWRFYKSRVSRAPNMPYEDGIWYPNIINR